MTSTPAPNKWLTDIELRGHSITLAPMTPEHRDALVEAASDGTLWALWYTGVPSPDNIDEYIDFALKEQQAGRAQPFVVRDNASGSLLGATRYLNVQPQHRHLEIGNTWYAKRAQRSGINTQCKLLLLTHAFERLRAIAVEFRTHWHNLPSRNAIARLGAKQDGVLRNHQIGRDGIYRDTVVFSIIESEWPAVKAALEFQLNVSRPQPLLPPPAHSESTKVKQLYRRYSQSFKKYLSKNAPSEVE